MLRGAESRRLLAASTQTIASSFYTQLTLMVSGPVVARMLGVDGRGYFAALSIWPLLITLLGGLGVPIASTFFLSQRPAEARRILGECCRIFALQVVLVTGLAAIILFAWSTGRPDEVRSGVYPTLLAVPAMLAHQYALAVVQSQRRFTVFNLLRVLPATLYTLGEVILFATGVRDLLPVLTVWAFSYVIPSIASVTCALRLLRPSWERLPGFRRELLHFALRGHLGAVSPIDSLRIDQAAIALLLSPAALGLYVVAYAFTNLPRFVADAAGRVAYPAIATRADRREKQRLVWLFFGGVTLVNVPMAAGLLVAMPWLVEVFFGSDFAAAVPISRVLLAGTTVVASRRILVEGLRGLGRPAASTIAEVSMYPWLAVTAPWALAHHGAIGLANALFGGYALSLAIALVMAVRGGAPGTRAATALFAGRESAAAADSSA